MLAGAAFEWTLPLHFWQLCTILSFIASGFRLKGAFEEINEFYFTEEESAPDKLYIHAEEMNRIQVKILTTQNNNHILFSTILIFLKFLVQRNSGICKLNRFIKNIFNI